MSTSIFDLTSRHADWIAQRRTIVAANVANANTPGYRSADIAPFANLLEGSVVDLARTDLRHLSVPQAPTAHDQQESSTDGAQHSGNTVDLEQEMLKTGDVSRAHLLNVAIIKAFHRMSLASVKG
jgi:flagellar basal-body rod protein FlgB